MNSWGASVSELKKLDSVIPVANHQVTTRNVDTFHWRADVEMFL